MRKAITLALALVMTLSLASCSGNNSNKDHGNSGGGSTSGSNPTTSQDGNKDDIPYDTSWPTREVRLIIPYAEGGGSHKVALMVKDASEKLNLMKNPFIAVCMPNAATLEGQEEVLYADPDGYTILIHHNAMINGYALGKQDFSYDDFRMVGQLYDTPMVISVRSDFPADNLSELADAIKSNPGKYTWTWAGSGGNTHFASYVFYNAAGISDSDIIPSITKGDSESAMQCAGGTADIVISQSNAVEEYVKSGDLKVLGNSSGGTIEVGGQSVPSWQEQGFNDTYLLRCFAFLPKETPDDVFNAVAAAFEKIVNSDEFATAMAAEGMIANWLPEDEAVAAFAKEAENANAIAEKILATQ